LYGWRKATTFTSIALRTLVGMRRTDRPVDIQKLYLVYDHLIRIITSSAGGLQISVKPAWHVAAVLVAVHGRPLVCTSVQQGAELH
jgi:hypothetical protein